jgi:C4-dicarboxylate-specific signal transduction histidine kinase
MLFEADYLKKLSQKMSEDPSAAVPLNGNELFQIGENLGRDIARCRRIIDHLRDFGRVSSNHPSSVNLNQPILDSFILVGEQLKNHSVVVQMDLNPALPFIAAEPHKLEQIFLNLINNAEYALMEMEQRVQAGVIEWPNYQKTLAISTHFEQGYVVATVRDNGCGLSALAKEHLFEPFFTTKPIGQGTGLGLSISYSIVREFDGEISYESSENAGATFTVRFPALGY